MFDGDTQMYEYLFIASTFWVGPFWFGMLFFPDDERTSKWVNTHWIFLGPLACWFFVLFLNPTSMLDMFVDLTPSGMLTGMQELLSSPEGTVLAWSHLVAGDIMITRWIWSQSIKYEINRNKMRASVFFGVMLMPVGLFLHVLNMRNVKLSHD